MSRLLVLVLVVAVSLCLTAGSAGAGGGSCYWHSKKDRELARKTNAARAKADVRKVSLDPHLSRVAKRQAKAMAQKATLYHTPSLGSLITRWRALAENVGFSSNVKGVHRAFMSSPVHKATC